MMPGKSSCTPSSAWTLETFWNVDIELTRVASTSCVARAVTTSMSSSGKRTVLIIGGTGNCAKHAIEALRGHDDVRVLASTRRPEAFDGLRRAGAEPVVLDLDDHCVMKVGAARRTRSGAYVCVALWVAHTTHNGLPRAHPQSLP